MPICPKCSVEADSGFCPECGDVVAMDDGEPEPLRFAGIQAEASVPAVEPQVPSFPGSIRAASAFWIIAGIVIFLLTLGGAVAEAVMKAENPGRRPNPGSGCSNTLGFAMAGGCLIAGIHLARRKMKDPLVPAILSLLGGLLYLALALFATVLLQGDKPQHPVFEAAMGVAAIVGGIVGCVLTLPAILALSGRSRYRAWRAATANAKKHRRQLRRQIKHDVYLEDDPEAEGASPTK